MKKVLKILTLIMLIFTILKIGDTYAKYFTEANTQNLSQDIAKWEIKINDLDLYSDTGEIVQIPINTFTNSTNEHTAPDRISPASQGYMNLILNPEGTDVAVRYDIEIILTGVADELAIAATLEMANGENTLVRTGEHTYTGIISLADVKQGKTADISCYVTWSNVEANNVKDSELGSQPDAKLNLLANVTVTQYLGEEITEYVEP